jgi:hypothetical protein
LVRSRALLDEDGDERVKTRDLGGKVIVASGLADMQLATSLVSYLVFATILEL